MQAFRKGARGPIVRELQMALKVTPDAIYGRDTTLAVMTTQERVGLNLNGHADPTLFKTVGLTWPTDYEICLQLTGQYESTGGNVLGYGGINNYDIDGAGVTMGIVGATTQHNEVQRLMARWYELKPRAFDILPTRAKGRLIELCKTPLATRKAWEHWFYGNDTKVDTFVRDVFRAWGEDPDFQKLQKDWAYQTKWLPAIEDAKRLKLKSLYGWGLMFDVRVQNGGWKPKHQAEFNKYTSTDSEELRLANIAKAVAAGASPKWRQDTLIRKMTFADGGGEVHGRKYFLTEYGFPKRS